MSLAPENYLKVLRDLEQARYPDESMRLQELAWALIAVGRYRDAQHRKATLRPHSRLRA